MADSNGITIVVKGLDGTGRTQLVEILKHALVAKGFTDVTALGNDGKLDLFEGTTSVRDQPILIVESKG